MRITSGARRRPRTLATAIVFSLIASLSGLAAPPAHGDGDPVRRELEQLREEVASIRQSLARLEEKLAGPKEAGGELSPLRVRVRDVEGNPVEGYKIFFVSQGEGRRVKASGTSGPDGVAIQRRLPYGDYRYSASGAHWSASGQRFHIEFGSTANLEIIVPKRDEICALRIRSALDYDSFTGMRFGEFHHGGRFPGQWYVPEPNPLPQRARSEWSAFPTIENGVEEVAASIRIRVSQTVEQPDGRRLAWQTSRAPSDQMLLFTSSGKAIPCSKIDKHRVTEPSRDARFFLPTGPNTKEYRGTAYYELLDAAERRSEVIVSLPAGEINLSVESFYGRASGEALDSLGIREEPPAGAWLAATLKPESGWISRTMGTSPWKLGSDRHKQGYAVQSFTLANDEERTVAVGLAANPAVQKNAD